MRTQNISTSAAVNAFGYTWAQLDALTGLSASGGMGTAWNLSGTWGETDILLNRYGGSESGIAFFDFPSTVGALTQLAAHTADGSLIGLPTGSIKGPGTLNVQGGYYNNGGLLVSPTAPTIASGGCTTGSAQSVSASNGSAAFQITLGGATCGSTITLTLPAATTNWVCDAHNVTTPASNVLDMTGVPSTTAVVLTNYVRTTGVAGNFTGAEKLAVKCFPY